MTYKVSSTQSTQSKGVKFDRRANGEFAGDDVRIIDKTDRVWTYKGLITTRSMRFP